MTTSTTAGNGNGNVGAQQRQFSLHQLYIKDVSFESPNAPTTFAEPFQPEMKLNLQSSHKQLKGDEYEVVLHVTVHATLKEKSLFLVELQQAGVFQISGYNPEEIKVILGAHCPTTLFPFAREAIYSLVGRGGFPPLLLQPINFEALYVQAQNRPQQVD
jgi:preprotein translocase subunit SecB